MSPFCQGEGTEIADYVPKLKKDAITEVNGCSCVGDELRLLCVQSKDVKLFS